MEEVKAIINSVGLTDLWYWDITLYALFFVNIIILVILPDGSTMGTMLSILVLICIFIDKTYAFGFILKPTDMTPEYCHSRIFIGTYLVRVVIFIAPLTIAGSTDEGKIRAGAIVAGIGGAVYSFLRWFMEQREVSTTRITCMNPAETEMVLQSLGIVLILAKVALRDRFLPGTIHRSVPVAVPLELAPHEVEI
jgi:hypothetical protein